MATVLCFDIQHLLTVSLSALLWLPVAERGCINRNSLEVSWYSLEQYIGFVVRQASNYCCSLHQV